VNVTTLGHTAVVIPSIVRNEIAAAHDSLLISGVTRTLPTLTASWWSAIEIAINYFLQRSALRTTTRAHYVEETPAL